MKRMTHILMVLFIFTVMLILNTVITQAGVYAYETVEPTTGLTATLVSGGSLQASTTYYYVIVAYLPKYLSYWATYNSPDYGSNHYGFAWHNAIVEEGTFTTNSTHKSVTLNWDNCDNCNYYCPMITTQSMNYTNSAGYCAQTTTTEAFTTLITDGTTGYTITAERTSANGQAVHDINFKNPAPFNLNKSLGLVEILFNESGTYDLQDIVTAVQTAGLDDYMIWDNKNLVLKGGIRITGEATVNIDTANIFLHKGYINVANANANLNLGTLSADGYPNTHQQVNIFISGVSRYPVASNHPNINFYGGSLYLGEYGMPFNDENWYLNGYTYTGRNQPYLGNDISGFMGTQLATTYGGTGSQGRGITSDVKDIWNYGEGYWSGGNKIRLLIPNSGLVHQYPDTSGFYDSTFTTSHTNGINRHYASISPVYQNRTTYYYDCIFEDYTNNILNKYILGGTLPNLVTCEYSNRFDIYNTIKIKTLLTNGSILTGVNVTITDKNDNDVTLREKDGSVDEIYSGNTYYGSRTVDANGIFDYYVLDYYLKHLDGDCSMSAVDLQEYYPLTITLSKSGYQDTVMILQQHTEPTSILGIMTEGSSSSCSANSNQITVQTVNRNDYIQIKTKT